MNYDVIFHVVEVIQSLQLRHSRLAKVAIGYARATETRSLEYLEYLLPL